MRVTYCSVIKWIIAAALFVLLAVVASAASWVVMYKLPPRGKAQLASAVAGQYSKFTLLAASYDARAPNLHWWIRHYSQVSPPDTQVPPLLLTTLYLPSSERKR